MKTCVAQLASITPYSASKLIDEDDFPFLDKETHNEYDMRTWREKSTYAEDGQVCIPAMAFKMSIDEAIKRLTITIPGKKGSTYTKFFLAGQICDDHPGVRLSNDNGPIQKDGLDLIKVWANADGVRGSGRRVKRHFPYVPAWAGTATFRILDDTIPKEIFERALTEAGRLVGVGRFRPEKGGFLGRFKVQKLAWSEE